MLLDFTLGIESKTDKAQSSRTNVFYAFSVLLLEYFLVIIGRYQLGLLSLLMCFGFSVCSPRLLTADLIYLLQSDPAPDLTATANFATHQDSQFASVYDFQGSAFASSEILGDIDSPINSQPPRDWTYFSSFSDSRFSYGAPQETFENPIEGFLSTEMNFELEVLQDDHTNLGVDINDVPDLQNSAIEYSMYIDAQQLSNQFDQFSAYMQIYNHSGEVFEGYVFDGPGTYEVSGVLPGYSDEFSNRYYFVFHTDAMIDDPYSIPLNTQIDASVLVYGDFQLVSAIPEPGGLALLLGGMLVLGQYRKRKQ